MSYENPQVPHEVNVSSENAVAEFLRLAAGVAIVVVATAAVLYFLGGTLARFIPYGVEREWVGERVLAPMDAAASGQTDPELQSYLQRLADELAVHMDLPAGMRPVLHWSESDVPNAFATLGGHIVVTRGLYSRLPSENALALVLAHELAHLRERDPIAAVGGSASLALVLVLLGSDVQRLVPHLAQAVQFGYSRRAERQADAAALAAVLARYGHAGGTEAVFELFDRETGAVGRAVPTLLATHPGGRERIEQLRRAAAGWDPATDPLRPLEVPAVRSPPTAGETPH